METDVRRPTHGGNLQWAAEIAHCAPHELLDFSASINPWGPPQAAIAAIQAHISQLRDYPDPSYGELRQAIAAFHQLENADLTPDWILPGNGAAELLTWAARELASQGSVGVLAPGFSDYQRALGSFGAEIIPLDLNPINLNPSADLEPSTLEPRARSPLALPLVAPASFAPPQAALPSGPDPAPSGHLINNPHNPTGQMWSLDAFLPLLEQGGLVVVDEAFMDFLPHPPSHSPSHSLIAWVGRYPNLVIVRSLTKFYSLPGLRLGYAIAHPERIRRWQQWQGPWSVNNLAAAVGPVLLQDHDFQRRTWEWLSVARHQLWQGLNAIPGLSACPSAANFCLVHSALPVPELQTRLLQQHRLLIRDCLSFAQLGSAWFRVAVRQEAENQQLLAAIAACLG
jgi:L-threonine-O-3-phosphate decarboxylase